MNKSIPPFREIIESFGWEWNDFKRALRSIDREAFEELLNHAHHHAQAGISMKKKNLFEPVVMSILVEHEKTLRKLREYVEREHS